MRLENLNVRELRDLAQDFGLTIPFRLGNKTDIIAYMAQKLRSHPRNGPSRKP